MKHLEQRIRPFFQSKHECEEFVPKSYPKGMSKGCFITCIATMHIVNFPIKRAPILCKHTCIH